MDMLRNKLRRNPKPSANVFKSTQNGKPSTSLPPALSGDAFQNHWRQVLAVIKRAAASDGTRTLTCDDVSAVVHNIEKMCDFLCTEEEENGQQGPCLVYLLAEDILQQLVNWCLSSGVYENKIKYELLKILENLIGQSCQPLLYHKPVIKPLLSLLGSCMGTTLAEIENHVILLLHQLCICISRNPQSITIEVTAQLGNRFVFLIDKHRSSTNTYLELFFNVSYSSGQNNFLIFCLLIPYIHREESLGQQARDALLLIMAASARNQVIGKYIAKHSDFCPVLATGLSGLYSSLPHKVRPEGHEDWYRIEKEHYLDMPDVQMIINCLEFCNAVVQVAHELVGQQLIEYIFNGFLVPVMAPALVQNSIEEQVSAIAYLELFVRTVTEPSLLRAFLHFILTTKYDEVVILEWLIDRISSSTKLCMVSLSLFKTLIELNCEDVMFGLCFKYLYRLTHVMQSQKRAIKQLDIYGKIAEKLLQLEPHCCRTALSEEQQRLLINYNDGIFSSGHTPTPTQLDEYKSSYMDYLSEAKDAIQNCSNSCSTWCYVYDGQVPPYNASLGDMPRRGKERSNSQSSTNKYDTPDHGQEDDVPLLQLNVSPTTPAITHTQPGVPQESADSILIDIAPINSPKLTCASTNLLSDDVPLCIADHLPQTPPQPSKHNEPLPDLEHLQQDMTLNLLLQAQNEPMAPLVSPPATSEPIELPALSPVAPISSSPCTSNISTHLSSEHFESFLSYLDDSVDHVTPHPDKPADVLLEEVDSLIEEAEIKVRKRNESQASAEKAETITQFDTGETLASIQPHPVDAGLQKLTFVDPRPRRRLPSDYNLNLDNTVDSTPSIGPFLTTLLNKLENMMNNSLSVNLLLTGLVARIASYPQPLLRSFLLNHSLVFQPSIKSLIQVLSAVSGKVDRYAEKIPNFNVLLLQARKIMMDRADSLDVESESADSRLRAGSVMSQSGKRLTDFFRRDKQHKQQLQPELVLEANGYRFTNVKQPEKAKFESAESRLAAINTKKAVYCTLVLEEFVKELAALSQEHAIRADEGYQTD